jgi:hypothetical protein
LRELLKIDGGLEREFRFGQVGSLGSASGQEVRLQKDWTKRKARSGSGLISGPGIRIQEIVGLSREVGTRERKEGEVGKRNLNGRRCESRHRVEPETGTRALACLGQSLKEKWWSPASGAGSRLVFGQSRPTPITHSSHGDRWAGFGAFGATFARFFPVLFEFFPWRSQNLSAGSAGALTTHHSSGPRHSGAMQRHAGVRHEAKGLVSLVHATMEGAIARLGKSGLPSCASDAGEHVAKKRRMAGKRTSSLRVFWAILPRSRVLRRIDERSREGGVS